MMKWRFIIFSLLICNKQILACTCFTPDAESLVKIHSRIFVGKLKSITDSKISNLYTAGQFGGPMIYYTFEVLKSLKHRELHGRNKFISILHENNNCAYVFNTSDLGKEFLIYADAINEYGDYEVLTVGACSGTKLVSEITDKFESNLFIDKSNWKFPENRSPYEDKIENESLKYLSMTQWTFLIIVLNLTLTIYLIFLRRK